MTVPFFSLFRTILLVLALSVIPAAYAQHASGDLDRRVDRIIQQITNYQYAEASVEVDQLIKIYPNFRLAHLIKGDLILMRAKPLQVLSGNGGMSEREREGLRTEALYRLQASRQKIPVGLSPANLLQLLPEQRYVIVVDTGRSRLYLLEHSQNQLKPVADYYMSIGRSGPDKQRRGDLRTPTGVYYVTSFIPSSKLPDYYGAGAFPINYPNTWDVRNKRDGDGIWIHGTPSNTWTRPPLASEGCVVVANADFLALKNYIQVGATPVVISTQIDWVPQDKLAADRANFLNLLNRWKTDFESLNTERYLSHYSSQFSADGMNYAQWVERKRAVNTSKTWITVNLSNISFIRYPGKQEMMVVTFDQDYKSSNLNNFMRKKQYWLKENGQWKIIYEGAV